MTLELLKAMVVILEMCLKQSSCKECPMQSYCQEMPCDW